VPVFLRGGTRLFDDLGDAPKPEQVEVVEAPGVTHIRYRFARRDTTVGAARSH
jgi:hypothetical protein